MSDLSRAPNSNLAYLARREAQERAAAERSADAIARRLHLQLAERYAALSNVVPLLPA